MSNPLYLPPAGIDDFGERPTAGAFKQQWHNYIANAIAARAGSGLFYDAQSEAGGEGPLPIPWKGFPKSISEWFNADTDPNGKQRAVATADVLAPLARVRRKDTGERWLILHRQQDEYCEWHADRNAAGQITRISFTAEGPEYWQTLAKVDPDLLLELYRKHISAAVQREDLFWPSDMIDEETNQIAFRAGDYNRWNKWTTQLGAMHLTHPANTLGAEINLAADATVVYAAVAPTPPDTLPGRLICCAGYGGVNRSSDPLIGAGVNELARAGKSVTLANPVGLYMSDVPIGGCAAPVGRWRTNNGARSYGPAQIKGSSCEWRWRRPLARNLPSINASLKARTCAMEAKSRAASPWCSLGWPNRSRDGLRSPANAELIVVQRRRRQISGSCWRQAGNVRL
jgi:hypothetical protein